jgi:hypothetical protein
MITNILSNFPPEIRVSILELVNKKVENDLHRLKMESDSSYVLEQMKLMVSDGKIFSYRGYLFSRDSQSVDKIKLNIVNKNDQTKYEFTNDLSEIHVLKPFIDQLILSTPLLSEEDYNRSYDDFTIQAFDLLDKCTVKVPIGVMFRVKNLLQTSSSK